MVRFLLTEITAGMRKGEICGLMWSDFDAKIGTLHVRRTLHRYEGGQLRTGETKTGAGKRKILLTRSTAQLLRERSKKSFSQWIFWNPIRPEEPVAPDSAYLAMKRILKKAGLPDIRFHDLRHTFATLALQTGADVKTVSSMLGHYSAGFTLDMYTHVTDHMQLQAADKMGSFMDRHCLKRRLCCWNRPRAEDVKSSRSRWSDDNLGPPLFQRRPQTFSEKI